MTLSYPRRQQLRRLSVAGMRATHASAALAAATFYARTGESALAAALLAMVAALAVSSRRSLRLAGRSRVGAVSEAQVRRALGPLRREGWQLRHMVDWPGIGDLDHVLRSQSGRGFVIETKTLRYARAHALRTADAGQRNSLDDELRRLNRYRLLVIDEIGYLPLERQAATCCSR